MQMNTTNLTTMSHFMIRDVLNTLEATGFDVSPLDTNRDDYTGTLNFSHSRYAAEVGESHMWSLYSLPNGQ